MFIAEDRGIRIVVEQNEIATPPDHNGKGGAEARADSHPQALGPMLRGSERRLRPIIGAHACTKFAAMRQEPIGHLGWRRSRAGQLRRTLDTRRWYEVIGGHADPPSTAQCAIRSLLPAYAAPRTIRYRIHGSEPVRCRVGLVLP